ncbi:MAG: hypothetical protein ACOY94_23500 [Bacillota bacterium]
MSGLLSSYTIMQESEWAGRRFCTARDLRTKHVVYLMGEPLGVLGGSHAHPNLPTLKEVGIEGQTRWWVGHLPEGDKLEDLRLQGTLTESELLSALLSALDALLSLSAMVPPPVPAYIDPACIVRDRLGRWVLDYMALAHAPEAHANNAAPPGVYPFGVLLYWVVTGETVRRARVQVSNLESVASPGLQLIIIRCLGRSYPSLAELRAEVSRAGKDREFQPVVQRIRSRAQVARTEAMSALVKGPHIPIDDRPWAAPPPPRGGYSRATAPLRYRKVRRPWTRWLATGLVGLLTFAVAGAVALRMQLIPPQYLPDWLRAVPVVTLFPKPEPVHLVHQKAHMPSQSVLVYLDGRNLGEAEVYASPTYPYMALEDLNHLFRRDLEWSLGSDGQALLREGDRSLQVSTYEQVNDGLWIKLLPAVQEWLGLQFESYKSGILHFSAKA